MKPIGTKFKAIVHRYDTIGVIVFKYKYDDKTYTLEVPITEANTNLKQGEEVLLSLQLVTYKTRGECDE